MVRRAVRRGGPRGRAHRPLSDGRFTFAVVGHDEAATLPAALGQAREAAAPGDRVWFVDSASTDGSDAVARALGAEVIPAPLGKGRAVAAALERCGDGFLCLIDADLEHASENVARRLREATVASGADMVVGAPEHPAGKRRSITPALYRPLVSALFPEAAGLDLPRPLSGFRVLRSGVPLGRLPAGYGVEAHLNVQLAVAGALIAPCPLGRYRGPLRGYANIAEIGAAVAAAVLDLAETHGRLRPLDRPAWQEWADRVVAVIREQPGEDADDAAYLRRLDDTVRQPLPRSNASR